MQESEPRGPRYRRAHGGPSLSPRIGLTTEKHAYRIDCGKYGGSFIAYSCEARLAVIDWRNGRVLLDQHVVTNQPPKSMKLGSGQNAGSFDVPRSLQALADALQ